MSDISEKSLEDTIEAELLTPEEELEETILKKMETRGRLLKRYLPAKEDALPKDIQQNIDMESYRLARRFKGRVQLERGNGMVTPKERTGGGTGPEEMEALSKIIQDLNERSGANFADEDKVFIQGLEQKLSGDPALVAAVRANPPENARLAFDHVATTDGLQDMVDSNFAFYKRVTDDKAFGRFFYDWLFDRFRDSLKAEERGKDKEMKG